MKPNHTKKSKKTRQNAKIAKLHNSEMPQLLTPDGSNMTQDDLPMAQDDIPGVRGALSYFRRQKE